MKSINVFSMNDISVESDNFIQHIDNGEMSLIMRQNRPSFLAVPFNERLLVHGINLAMAINLFEMSLLTISQAAKIANLPIENFIEIIGEESIPVVDYSPEDLLLEIDDI